MTQTKKAPVIGVLAVQGAFIEHRRILGSLGAKTFEIRQLSDLNRDPAETKSGKFPFDGLVLPGGESTVQGKLLKDLGLFNPLKKLIQDGLPVFGTCAGLILLAQKLSNDGNVYFGTLPVTVQRNAYGRQLGSFFAELPFKGITNTVPAEDTIREAVPMTFIRAPVISSVGEDVEVLAEVHSEVYLPQIVESYQKPEGDVVAVRYKNQLGITFHPELNEDTRIHQYFLSFI